MELMKLNKRFTLAKRGHRLLKDKQDDLMDRFTDITKNVNKIRNKIAHEVDYKFTQLEAKKTLSQFERVFREFEYI